MTIILFIIALALLPYAFVVGFYILMYAISLIYIIFKGIFIVFNKGTKFKSFLGTVLIYGVSLAMLVPIIAFFDK